MRPCSRPASSRSRTTPSARRARPRVAALRTELARRGLTGFIVPRSDRHQNEYVPASEERLAWLTGFTGSAGTAIVLMERAVLFVDGRYTLQAREQVDTCAVRRRAPGRDAARQLDRAEPHRQRPPRLRPLAAHRRRRREARQGLRRGRRDAGRGRARPDRCDLGATALPRRSAPVTLHDLRFAGETAERQARAHPRRAREAARRRAGGVGPARRRLDLQHPRRRRRAHAAAARLRHRAARGPARRSMSTAASSRTTCATASKHSPTCASPPISSRDLARSAQQKKTVRLDQATAADALARLVTEPRRQGRARRRPDRADEGGEERRRDRRRARRASCATAPR